MRGFLRVLGVLACSVLFSTAAFAQGGGTIAGVVRDTSGAVLPGVTVEAASPALIERVRTVVTDGTGQYRIVDLRPGTYTVTATLTGFNTFQRDGIEISGIAIVTINVDLRVGAITETVTVSGETPVVDLQSTTRERVMSKEVLDVLPTGRMYGQLGVLVPGVNSTGRDIGGSTGATFDSLTAHGGSAGDQRILQNGLNIMTLVTAGGNVGGVVPNTTAAQEVAIDTAAASAERQTGGVSVNFIPKDGGNTIRGSIFATAAYEGQQASNFTQRLRDQGLTRVNKYKDNWDVNPGIGGPILRDKLWYYYTYRNNGARVYSGGQFFNLNEWGDPANRSTWVYEANRNRPALSVHGDWWDSQLRLTWQVNPKNKVAGTWDQQFLCRCPNNVSFLRSPEASAYFRFPTQRLLHGEWWSPLTSKLLIEVVGLHRTERYNGRAMGEPLRLTSHPKGGDLVLTPQQYARYPYLVGVTQTNAAGDAPAGIAFHGPALPFNTNWTDTLIYRWAVSYITGSHALKFGGQDSFGPNYQTDYMHTIDAQGNPYPVRYRFGNPLSPNQVTVFQSPVTVANYLNHDFGLFVQDRWTRDRLSVTGGVRFDYFNSEIPAQELVPTSMGRAGKHFDAVPDVLNWKDVTPRLGASYDLRGDGKTAVKVSLSKYVAGQALGGLAFSANPIDRLARASSRNWNDADNDLFVDCNLTNRLVNGECTNAGSPASAYQIGIDPSCATLGAFNCTVPNPLIDQDIREGWNVRGYNWEFSLGAQHEILPRVSLEVSYFRRWFGNFTTTDNTAVAASEFDTFDAVVPLDSRLPGGGGYRIEGFVDPKTTAIAQRQPVNKVVRTDSLGATRIERWNGVDVSVNARLRNGLLLQGGTSTGRRYTNDCEVSALLPETLGSNAQSFCETTEPFLTQVKLVGAYTLPRYAGLPPTMGRVFENIQIGATFQSIPGAAKSATYQMTNAEFQNPALSNLSVVNPAHGDGAGAVDISNSNIGKSIALIHPGASVYDERSNQLDLRIGKVLRYGRTRTSLNLDLYNVTNRDTVFARNNALSKVTAGTTPSPGAANQAIQADGLAHSLWAPTSIMQARFFKLSVTFDF